MTSVRRRELLQGGVAAALLGTGTGARAEDSVLKVTHFGGPYEILNEIIAKPFTAAKLGRMEYSVEISPSVVAKLQAQRGNPPFDVAMVSRAFGVRALNAGLLEKVSPSDFSQSPTLVPDAIPAPGWGVAMALDTFDIMIDTKEVKTPLTSWLDLWRPEFKGKLALPAAANGAAAFAFMSCIMRSVGGDDRSDSLVNDVFARLKALKSYSRVFYPDSIQPTQLIERGEITIAPQFGIRIANQTKVSPNIVKVTPKEGVAAIPYDLCIAKGSRNIDLAKKYIDFTLTKSVQEALVTKLYATPARTGLDVPADIAALVTLDPKKIWFQDEAFAASKQREWLDRYTREVQS